MALSTSLKSTCNNILDDVVTQMATIQSNYYNTEIETGVIRGRYWQGVPIVNTIPADGATETPDLTKKPTDQTENWEDIGIDLPSGGLEICLEVATYKGPNGDGYVVCGTVKESGIIYKRCINVGPETHRGHDWKEISGGI